MAPLPRQKIPLQTPAQCRVKKDVDTVFINTGSATLALVHHNDCLVAFRSRFDAKGGWEKRSGKLAHQSSMFKRVIFLNAESDG